MTTFSKTPHIDHSTHPVSYCQYSRDFNAPDYSISNIETSLTTTSAPNANAAHPRAHFNTSLFIYLHVVLENFVCRF